MRFKHHAVSLFLIGIVAGCAGAPDQDASGADVQAVTIHSRAQVAQWFQQASPEVLAVPSTVLAYHDEIANRIVVGVENAAASHGVLTALAHLGIPSSAVTIQETAPIYQLATLRDRWRPMIAGVQLHFGNFLCSLGFN